MTIDHDFGYSLPLFSFLLKKEGRIKGEWLAKIVIKSHTFLLDLLIEEKVLGKNIHSSAQNAALFILLLYNIFSPTPIF